MTTTSQQQDNGLVLQEVIYDTQIGAEAEAIPMDDY